MQGRWIRLGVLALGLGGIAYGQKPKTVPEAQATVDDEQQLASRQGELLRLLRVSPTLTEVVARDPSLLSDKSYVTRWNPELEKYLAAHPEITRNPDYYLFSGFKGQGRRGPQALERKVWPEYAQPVYIQPASVNNSPPVRDVPPQTLVAHLAVPLIVFFCILGALLWLIYLFVTGRSKSRMFHLQMEAHERMLDRFANSQELLRYMELSKSSLEPPSIPARLVHDGGVPNVVKRVTFAAQMGLVLALLGAGLLYAQSHERYDQEVLLVAGLVLLMPGLGFILSAALTWTLADRLGLLPGKAAERADEL